mmetsp:Transcript_145223/g.368518  ORF Transcript_145223/g.368518 Transcript_145223/m.368518 type:complete len:286 (-) Transcript_145223:7-864(-)
MSHRPSALQAVAAAVQVIKFGRVAMSDMSCSSPKADAQRLPASHAAMAAVNVACAGSSDPALRARSAAKALRQCSSVACKRMTVLQVMMLNSQSAARIPPRTVIAPDHFFALAHVLSTAFRTITLGSTFSCCMPPSRAAAVAQRRPCSHALTATPQANTSGSRPQHRMLPSPSRAASQAPPLPQAAISALSTTTFLCNPAKVASASAARAARQARPAPQAETAALYVPASGWSPWPKTSICKTPNACCQRLLRPKAPIVPSRWRRRWRSPPPPLSESLGVVDRCS